MSALDVTMKKKKKEKEEEGEGEDEEEASSWSTTAEAGIRGKVRTEDSRRFPRTPEYIPINTFFKKKNSWGNAGL